MKIRPASQPWFLHPWFSLGRSPFLVLFVALLLPTGIFVYTVFGYIHQALKAEAVHQNQVAARLAARVTEEHFKGLAQYAESFAGSPALIELMSETKTGQLRKDLREFVNQNQDLGHALITDPKGIEWADYPHDPLVSERDLSFHDWYRGVSRTRRTYISEIYQRKAQPGEYLVAIATPIKNEKGTILGFLAAHHTIEDLSGWFSRIRPAFAGSLVLIDHHGRLAVRVGVENEPPLDLSRDPVVQKALVTREGGREEALDPVTGMKSIVSYVRVDPIGWVILSSQQVAAIFVLVEKLRPSLWFLGLIFFASLLALFGVWWRTVGEYHRIRERAETTFSRLAAIGESSGDALIVMDVEGRVVSWNAGAEKIYGYSRAEMEQEFIHELVPPDRLEEIRSALKSLKLGEAVSTFDTVHRGRNGGMIDILLTLSSVKDPAGKLIGILAIGRNISEKKSAERRLAMEHELALILAGSASLEEATPRVLQCICETMRWDLGAVWYVDRDEQVLKLDGSWHPPSMEFPHFESASREITFKLGENFPGRIWETGKPEWMGDVADEPSFLRARFAQKEGLHGAFGFPLKVRDETVGVMEFFGRETLEFDEKILRMFAAIGGQMGQFLERRWAEKQRENQSKALKRSYRELARREKVMLSLLEDLEAKRKLEEEKRSLEEANKRLAEISSFKDELVSTVSHELRTPLAAAKEGVSLLLDRVLGPLNEEQEDFLKTIDANMEQLTELIRNMLDLSKIELGRIRLMRRRMDIGDIIQAVVQHYRTLAGERALNVDLAPVSEVYADPNRVFQVLGNLFSNAIKFTQGKGTITFSVKEEGGAVTVSVKDDGVGISEEDQPRLFKKFTQLGEGEKRVRGTGLGLAVSKELVEFQKGKIWVESQPGKGATFLFTLPIYTSEFALEESFNERLEAAKHAGSAETVGLVILDGEPLAKGVPSAKSGAAATRPEARLEERLETVVEFLRQHLDAKETVLFVEPHWIAVITPSADPWLIQPVVRRLRSTLEDWVDKTSGGSHTGFALHYGTAIYPRDGKDIKTLFAKATTSLNHVYV